MPIDHPLIRWRATHRLSQQELAFRCDVTQSVISACERGLRVPQGKTFVKLLEVKGLPLEALTNLDGFLAQHPDVLGGPPSDESVLGRPRRPSPPPSTAEDS
jgi:transcriptional regulator with XRE-family HTH domain